MSERVKRAGALDLKISAARGAGPLTSVSR
jgi:hypothetical protein